MISKIINNRQIIKQIQKIVDNADCRRCCWCTNNKACCRWKIRPEDKLCPSLISLREILNGK